MTWSRGTAYGLSTPIDDWWSRGACTGAHEDPNLWFAERHRREALHVCRRHCPVLAQCEADALRRPPSFAVQGGQAWNGTGEILYGGAVQPARHCHRCPPLTAAAPPSRPCGLTRTELRVARLLCDTDLTAQQIADGFDVSLETVKTHVRHVYWKVGVRCRAELQASPLLKEEPCSS